MNINKQFGLLANAEVVRSTIDALKKNGMEAEMVESKIEAKMRLLELIPPGAEVFTQTSETLKEIGVVEEINESGRFSSVRMKMSEMDRNSQKQEMNRMGAAPEITVGSVHAVSKNGKVIIASNTGSQLPAYAYGAGKVIWVVGSHKIVEDVEEGLRRVYEYSLPLESERAKVAYGVEGSNVSKILIVNKETTQGRIKIIFVNQKLGY